MHCEKCWQYTEEAKWLQEKSNQKLCDWSNFLVELPSNLSKVCEDNAREYVWHTLNDAPSDKFPFKEWWEFLNDSICSHGIRFTELALQKMEDTAETEEDRLNYQKVAQGLQERLGKGAKQRVIVHI